MSKAPGLCVEGPVTEGDPQGRQTGQSKRPCHVHPRPELQILHHPATPTLLLYQKDVPGGPAPFLRHQEVLVQLQPLPAIITASSCFATCHGHFRAAIFSTRVAARQNDFRAAIFTA